jgi:chemotaxis protein MotB
MAQEIHLRDVQDNLMAKLGKQPDLSRLAQHTEINLTSTGLLIELVEANDTQFFESGSAEVPPATRKLLAVIARELSRLPNPVNIAGYTDAAPYRGNAGYSNWELSSARANAARRVMEGAGLPAAQMAAVCGYADRQPRNPAKPLDPSNRRVAILVGYQGEPPVPDGPAGGSSAPFRLDIRPTESGKGAL